VSKTIRIGCASGFYGDSQLAARQLVDAGNIDYLVFDYLAEITMAILAKARSRDDSLGYAVDFVTVAMKDVLADCARKGIKVVANAGGVNVPACIAALEALCQEQGLNLKIGGVYGDNLIGRDDLPWDGLTETQTGEVMPDRPASVNAYLGARPVADALAAGADVVVTGRVVDSAVMLGPLIHEFGWAEDQYDELAQGSLCGHVIECGAQCTGGNYTDWHTVPDFSNISYPVAEVSSDGSFVIGIPEGSGGLATVGSVGEQVLYEIGDPANYLLPDVACDFTKVTLEQIDDNQVRVSGARGRPPGEKYKVCATWRDGFQIKGCIMIGGPRALDKARTAMDAWIKRVRDYYGANALADFRQVDLEYFGAEHTYGPHATAQAQATREIVAKFGLHHDDPTALQFAANEMVYLGTSGVPGFYGLGGGRIRPSGLMRVHSTLIEKSLVPVIVQVGDERIAEKAYETDASEPTAKIRMEVSPPQTGSEQVEVTLESLAFARSGDKGNNANIGLIARKPEYLPYIHEQVTAQVVEDYFAHLVEGEVERFDLPGFNAFNFFMTEALGGGGTASVRTDCQGKSLAQQLLSLKLTVPATLL
jgi:Acyclic terpene utilisation family protein AtuA